MIYHEVQVFEVFMSEFSEFANGERVKPEAIAAGNDTLSPTVADRIIGSAMIATGLVGGILGATVPGMQPALAFAPALLVGGAIAVTKGYQPPPPLTEAQKRAARKIALT